jgi:hypothetical protein
LTPVVDAPGDNPVCEQWSSIAMGLSAAIAAFAANGRCGCCRVLCAIFSEPLPADAGCLG